jgi:hypothetical protein
VARPVPSPTPDLARPLQPTLDEDDLDVLPDENDVEALLGEDDLDLGLAADAEADLPAVADLGGAAADELPAAYGGGADVEVLPEVEEEMVIERPRQMLSTPPAAPPAAPVRAVAPAAPPVAAPAPASAAPAYETEVELDPGDLEDLGDLDLADAPEFDVDAPPRIGGDAAFSEGDFAAISDEDPNAKTQPDLEVLAAPAGPSAAAAAAPAAPAGQVDLFGDAGTDLSLFDDDDSGSR